MSGKIGILSKYKATKRFRKMKIVKLLVAYLRRTVWHSVERNAVNAWHA
jgi:hypothetical protein